MTKKAFRKLLHLRTRELNRYQAYFSIPNDQGGRDFYTPVLRYHHKTQRFIRVFQIKRTNELEDGFFPPFPLQPKHIHFGYLPEIAEVEEQTEEDGIDREVLGLYNTPIGVYDQTSKEE